MRLGIDVDGVLVDFNAGYIERIKEVTGRNLYADPPVLDVWHHAEKAGYTPKELRKVWDNIKADPWFWYDLKAYPDASPTMPGLQQRYANGDDIYFITARPGALAKRQTEAWFSDLPYLPTVLMSPDKRVCCDALRLDHYVDDNFENACAVAQAIRTESYLLTRPWNVQKSTPPGVHRVESLDDFFARLG